MIASRRQFLVNGTIGGLGVVSGLRTNSLGQSAALNREAIVRRHNPRLRAANLMSPMQVGNGSLGFSADITGLQTFAEEYAIQTPLSTLSEWGWHSFPNSANYSLSEAWKNFDASGREVPYLDAAAGEIHPPDASPRVKAATKWLIQNPHRILLARIGLILPNGQKLALAQLSNIDQNLDLWTGTLVSVFSLEGADVEVTTVCHPTKDILGVKIRSTLLATQGLGISLGIPYASGGWDNPDDWNSPDRYTTQLKRSAGVSRIACILDATKYHIEIQDNLRSTWEQSRPHQFSVIPNAGQEWKLSFMFSPLPVASASVDFDTVYRESRSSWRLFWLSGGAMDFSECTDARAGELERRVVLSQYLTKVNSSGRMPPPETGFISDSWFGKFHLEMHWWHSTHFILWNRAEIFERCMPWYFSIMPAARETAHKQGYRGVRWPKEVGPDGRETPSDIGVFLIWQQPHPIYYSEMLYQQNPTRNTLERYKILVDETAEFMASYAHWDESTRRYSLGPPLIPAEEEEPSESTRNPTFELAYWYWGLSTAQRWRERLGLTRRSDWDTIIQNLTPPTVRNGIYTEVPEAPYISRRQHPAMLGALGMLPAMPDVDKEVMRRTLKSVLANWNWNSCWGWDFPLMAMSAARLGEPDLAVDALLMPVPKNNYLINGHNFQISVQLPAYLPGNGGTLSAAAMMAAGWTGAGGGAPGFPNNSRWCVKWENLRSAL